MSTNKAVELWAKAVLAAEDAAVMLDLAWDYIAELVGSADALKLRESGVDLRTAYKSLAIRDEIEAKIKSFGDEREPPSLEDLEPRECETCGKLMHVPPSSDTTECSRCLE